jgi:hypothetical protein
MYIWDQRPPYLIYKIQDRKCKNINSMLGLKIWKKVKFPLFALKILYFNGFLSRFVHFSLNLARCYSYFTVFCQTKAGRPDMDFINNTTVDLGLLFGLRPI